MKKDRLGFLIAYSDGNSQAYVTFSRTNHEWRFPHDTFYAFLHDFRESYSISEDTAMAITGGLKADEKLEELIGIYGGHRKAD